MKNINVADDSSKGPLYWVECYDEKNNLWEADAIGDANEPRSEQECQADIDALLRGDCGDGFMDCKFRITEVSASDDDPFDGAPILLMAIMPNA